MKIVNAQFITSFANAKLYSEGEYAAEVCFAGRSNVGKSTFINTLLGQKLAKTSSTPGRTRLINIFNAQIRDENGEDTAFTLTDLPGYGFNRASKTESEKWGELIEGYFATSKVKMVFLLVDCRVKSPLDDQMAKFLYYYRIPFCVLLSKCDKLTKSELNRSVMEISAHLKIGRDNIISTSHNGLGRQEIIQKIHEIAHN